MSKHNGLDQVFKWMHLDEEIDRSPIYRVRQPKTPQKLIPIIRDDDTKRVLDACRGKELAQLRDQAIIRMLYYAGARLSEVANLIIAAVGLNLDTAYCPRQGRQSPVVRFGPKTGQGLSQYLRARANRRSAGVWELRLAVRAGLPLSANGVKIRLCRRGVQAGWTVCTHTDGGTTMPMRP